MPSVPDSSQLVDFTGGFWQSRACHLFMPVLVDEESAEMLYILLLFRECELAFAELAVFEMNGNFLNAMQVTLHHQL